MSGHGKFGIRPPNGVPPRPALDGIVRQAQMQEQLAQAMASARPSGHDMQLISFDANPRDQHGKMLHPEAPRVFRVQLTEAGATQSADVLSSFYVAALALHVSGAILFMYGRPFVKGAAKIKDVPVPVSFASHLHFSAIQAKEWVNFESTALEPWMRTGADELDALLAALNESPAEYRTPGNWLEWIEHAREALHQPSTTSAEPTETAPEAPPA